MIIFLLQEFGDNGLPVLELESDMLRLNRVKRQIVQNQTIERALDPYLFNHVISLIQNSGT